MEGYRERLARAIKAHYKETGIGPGELADRVGVGSRTVERWESGAAAPQPGSRRKLAEILGVPVESLQPDHLLDPLALDRIEAKLDRLLLHAGLPLDFEAISQELEEELGSAYPPTGSNGPRNGAQGPA